ncbi:FAD/NAD(P)-binding domain-containing protein [Hypoxylon sp. FL1284]|nr:FAD/NAD(P)-binding domain-containing protein [Hypoxylon sp. FL1284]
MSGALTLINSSHGYGIRVVHRPEFVEVLYKTLPEDVKNRIKLKKQVVNVNVFDDYVRVECADGTFEEGSVIIGADGVHSRIRQCMQAFADGKPHPGKSLPSKSPYLATYRMVFGNIPVPEGQEASVNYEGASERVSTQLITGTSRAWIAVYDALDEPTSERIRYTAKDKDRMLEKYGHLYVSPNLTVREVFAMRTSNLGMVNLEEGQVDKWTWRRIVLVGDAVRKLEPHAGLGYNSGVADVVALTNKLRRLLQTDSSPTTETLEALFAEYQSERQKFEPTVDSLSRRRARATGWLSPMNKVMTKYVAPWTNLAYYAMRYINGPFVSSLPVLEWLEEKGLPEAYDIPYKYHPMLDGMELDDPKKRSRSRGPSSSSLSIFTGTAMLAAFAAVGFQYYRRLH